MSGWGERYYNNVHYVKNNEIFEPSSMRACTSTPPKQNKDCKEHNRSGVKNSVSIKNLGWEENIYFQMFRILSQNVCVFWQSYLHSLLNQLSSDKLFLYSLLWFIHNVCTMERFMEICLNLDSNKEIRQ